MMGVGAEANRLVSYSGDAVSMYTHCGTHVDALNHFGYHGQIFNGFDAAGPSRQPALAGRRRRQASAGDRARHAARCRRLCMGSTMLPPSYGIGPDDLAGCLKHQRTELRPGDVVMIRTGRMRAWPDPAPTSRSRRASTGPAPSSWPRAARSPSAPTTTALEQAPSADPENWQVVHTYLLAEAGIPIMEIVDLEELAAERIYEFASSAPASSCAAPPARRCARSRCR